MKKLIYLCIIVALMGCLQENDLNLPLATIIPSDLEDGLEISNPKAEGIDNHTINQVYQAVQVDDQLWSIRSLLVLRNNKLLAEHYFKSDDDISTQHLIWSSTKQVMGVLTGIAVDQGLIESIDDPISKYMPDELANHPDKANITIRNLITMQSGIGFENDGLGGQTDQVLRQQPDNLLEFILNLPMIAEPGTVFHYNDGDPQLMACLLQKIVGRPTDEWAEDVLFSKAGISNYNWVRYKDGFTFGGFGIETTPRELGKFGFVIANNGYYNNQQIVSTSWLSEMLSPQVESNMDSEFGFYWWMMNQDGIYFTWGHGGQFVFIVPEKDLVVVVTAIPNTQGDYQIHANEFLPYVHQLIDACEG